MPEPDEFQDGTNWQQASGPHVIIQVHEADIWPVADNSGSGTKDAIAGGLHPVIAIGGRTAADGRPLASISRMGTSSVSMSRTS
jgi:hypothetical protein